MTSLSDYKAYGACARALHDTLNAALDDFGLRKAVPRRKRLRNGDAFRLEKTTYKFYCDLWELAWWNGVARDPAKRDHAAPLAGLDLWGLVDGCICREFPDLYSIKVNGETVPLTSVTHYDPWPPAEPLPRLEETPEMTERDLEASSAQKSWPLRKPLTPPSRSLRACWRLPTSGSIDHATS